MTRFPEEWGNWSIVDAIGMTTIGSMNYLPPASGGFLANLISFILNRIRSISILFFEMDLIYRKMGFPLENICRMSGV